MWWIPCGLASIVYGFFDKNSSGGTTNNGIFSKQQLAEELHKPIIRKFGKNKVLSFSITCSYAINKYYK